MTHEADDDLAVGVGVGVHADSALIVLAAYLAIVHRLAGHILVGIDVLEKPVEALALELLTQRHSIAHVAIVAEIEQDALIEDVLVGVEPHLGQAHGVLAYHVHLGGPLVRTALAEDVADVAAGRAHQLAAAHPQLERHFKILATPNLHARVVSTQRLEILAIYGKQSTLLID